MSLMIISETEQRFVVIVPQKKFTLERVKEEALSGKFAVEPYFHVFGYKIREMNEVIHKAQQFAEQLSLDYKFERIMVEIDVWMLSILLYKSKPGI